MATITEFFLFLVIILIALYYNTLFRSARQTTKDSHSWPLSSYKSKNQRTQGQEEPRLLNAIPGEAEGGEGEETEVARRVDKYLLYLYCIQTNVTNQGLHVTDTVDERPPD